MSTNNPVPFQVGKKDLHHALSAWASLLRWMGWWSCFTLVNGVIWCLMNSLPAGMALKLLHFGEWCDVVPDEQSSCWCFTLVDSVMRHLMNSLPTGMALKLLHFGGQCDEAPDEQSSCWGVCIHWTGLLDWITGPDYWTNLSPFLYMLLSQWQIPLSEWLYLKEWVLWQMKSTKVLTLSVLS